MKVTQLLAWIAGPIGMVLLGGCASTPAASSAQAGVDQIPRVTALYNRATERHVHPFRKPLRDDQARTLQLLQSECDRMLADVQSWENSAVLTAASEPEKNAVKGDIRNLEASLTALRDAAGKGDTGNMRSAHGQAVGAYARVHDRMEATAR